MTRPGPKPGPSGSQRSARLVVRVTSAELSAYQAAAGRAGVSMGALVRGRLASTACLACDAQSGAWDSSTETPGYGAHQRGCSTLATPSPQREHPIEGSRRVPHVIATTPLPQPVTETSEPERR